VGINSRRSGGKEDFDFDRVSLGNDVVLFANAGAPTDGTDGTGVGIAGPGSICLSYDTDLKAYINGGTKASPLWKLVTSAT